MLLYGTKSFGVSLMVRMQGRQLELLVQVRRKKYFHFFFSVPNSALILLFWDAGWNPFFGKMLGVGNSVLIEAYVGVGNKQSQSCCCSWINRGP